MRIAKNACRIGVFSLAATLATMAGAQPTQMPARGPLPFADYDADGNGLISEAEFNEARAERIAGRQSQGGAMRAPAGPLFSTFDSDGDGQLTPAELTAGQQAQLEKRRASGKGQGMGPGQGMGAGRQRPAFDDYDLNGDAVIGEAEFNEARGERINERTAEGYPMRNLGNAPTFADIDLDGNGEVSREEFTRHQQARPPQGK